MLIIFRFQNSLQIYIKFFTCKLFFDFFFCQKYDIKHKINSLLTFGQFVMLIIKRLQIGHGLNVEMLNNVIKKSTAIKIAFDAPFWRFFKLRGN